MRPSLANIELTTCNQLVRLDDVLEALDVFYTLDGWFSGDGNGLFDHCDTNSGTPREAARCCAEAASTQVQNIVATLKQIALGQGGRARRHTDRSYGAARQSCE